MLGNRLSEGKQKSARHTSNKIEPRKIYQIPYPFRPIHKKSLNR